MTRAPVRTDGGFCCLQTSKKTPPPGGKGVRSEGGARPVGLHSEHIGLEEVQLLPLGDGFQVEAVGAVLLGLDAAALPQGGRQAQGVLLTSARTGLGLDRLLARLDQLLAGRVRPIKVLLPYDALGLAAPLRERGSVQAEEYRPDGLYLEAIAKREELHLFEPYML